MEKNKIYYAMVNGESKTKEEFENFLKEKNIVTEKIYDNIVNKNFDK